MKSGVIATSSAAMPDGIRRSATPTSELPSMSNDPTIAAVRNCGRVTAGARSHSRGDEHDEPGKTEPTRRQNERRNRLDRETNSEIRGAPDQVNRGEGREHRTTTR
jgi:hypothetical protein